MFQVEHVSVTLPGGQDRRDGACPALPLGAALIFASHYHFHAGLF